MVTPQEIEAFYQRNISRITKQLTKQGSPYPNDHAHDVFKNLLTNKDTIHNLKSYATQVVRNIINQIHRSMDYRTDKTQFDEDIHSTVDTEARGAMHQEAMGKW